MSKVVDRVSDKDIEGEKGDIRRHKDFKGERMIVKPIIFLHGLLGVDGRSL